MPEVAGRLLRCENAARDYALDIQRFQAERAQRDGPSHINHMTSLLQQILKRAGLWEQVGRGFEPLPLPKNSPGRCITDDEEKAILRAALLHKRWEHLYFFILLSLHTTMGPGEAMGIRLKDIDLEKKQVSVRDAKNRFRVREIPLNDVALGVCREVLLWPR